MYPEAMRLAGAMIYVRDLARMKDFYQEMLGTQPLNTEWMDIRALFDAGGTRFALHAIPTEIAQTVEVSSPAKARESSPMKLIFAVDSVPEERKRLEAMGIKTLQQPWQKTSEVCEGVGPEGNIFQISSVRL